MTLRWQTKVDHSFLQVKVLLHHLLQIVKKDLTHAKIPVIGLVEVVCCLQVHQNYFQTQVVCLQEEMRCCAQNLVFSSGSNHQNCWNLCMAFYTFLECCFDDETAYMLFKK